MFLRHRPYVATSLSSARPLLTSADSEGIWTVRAHWNTQTTSCQVFSSKNDILAAFYLYSE